MLTKLNEFTNNVVIYIAGFITRKMEKLLKREICVEALVSQDDTSINNQLFRIKTRGKLRIPSKSVIDIYVYKVKKKI